MTRQGEPPFGGGPDQPDDDDSPPENGLTPEERLGGPSGAGDTEPLRGWIPPDQRSWRHPSELFGASAGPSGTSDPAGATAFPFGTQSGRRPRHRRRRTLATAVITTGAAAAVVAGVVLLVDTGTTTQSNSPSAGARPQLSAAPGCCRWLPASDRAADRSLVSLWTPGVRGSAQACGVVVGPGGLVATTAAAVSGRRWLAAMTPSGTRMRATVVASDPTSDVALVRVDDNLPTPPFADDTVLSSLTPTAVMALAPRPRSGAATMVAAEDVRSVGSSVPPGPGQGMAGIVTSASEVPAVPGEVLVDGSGQVVGLLDRSSSAASGGAQQVVYLPAAFVVGVAHQLATSGKVSHGWLDVRLENAPGTATTPTTGLSRGGPPDPVTATSAPVSSSGGAEVVWVDDHGASAKALDPGDVIVGVDGAPVRSTAELRSRLYVLPPGSRVLLDLHRSSTVLHVTVSLSPN